jgi:methionyl-tRNA formyltransferase
VVAAYGLILPQWVLDLPRLGCLNIHASLLPRWRGAAPIQRAIESGDSQTGITIMQMDAGLDTGDALLERVVPIGARQNAAQLHDALALAGGEAIVEALQKLAVGGLVRQPQPQAGVTYAAKLDKTEAALDFTQTAQLLERRVRAFNPAPGATVRLPGLADPVKVWEARVLTEDHGSHAPGSVVAVSAQGIDIAASPGILRLTELQKAGGKRQPVDVFVKGWQPPASQP